MVLEARRIDVDDLQDTVEIVQEMVHLAARHHGWINVQPEVPADQLPTSRSLLQHLFRRNSPEIALGTWTPAASDTPEARQYIGLQHNLGTRIIPELDRLGIDRPESWRRVQDSPRRGLVLSLPHDEDFTATITWLLKLTNAASTIRTTGCWNASIHQGHATR